MDYHPSGNVRQFAYSLEETPEEKHDHVDMVLGDGKILRYTDLRRFGAWLWADDLATCPVLANLGPEPLNDDFDAAYLFAKSRKRNTPVKKLADG